MQKVVGSSPIIRLDETRWKRRVFSFAERAIDVPSNRESQEDRQGFIRRPGDCSRECLPRPMGPGSARLRESLAHERQSALDRLIAAHASPGSQRFGACVVVEQRLNG